MHWNGIVVGAAAQKASVQNFPEDRVENLEPRSNWPGPGLIDPVGEFLKWCQDHLWAWGEPGGAVTRTLSSYSVADNVVRDIPHPPGLYALHHALQARAGRQTELEYIFERALLPWFRQKLGPQTAFQWDPDEPVSNDNVKPLRIVTPRYHCDMLEFSQPRLGCMLGHMIYGLKHALDDQLKYSVYSYIKHYEPEQLTYSLPTVDVEANSIEINMFASFVLGLKRKPKSQT